MVSRGGKAAVTDYKTVRTFGSTASLVECRLATGRTHQIRVHMASIGNPIIGDTVYGGRRASAPKANTPLSPLAKITDHALHAF